MKTWEKFVYGGLTLYALALHSLWIYAVPDPVIYSDSISYLQPALSLLFNHRFDLPPERTPGYPLFLYCLLRIDSSFSIVLIIQHLLAIGTMVLTGWLTRRALKLPLRFTFAAAIVSGIFPIALVASHGVLTETLYTTLSLGSLCWLFHAQGKNGPRYIAAAAVCAGAALWIRPAGWALAVALLAGLMGPILRRKKANLKNVGWACAVGLVVLSPIYVWNWTRHQVWGITAFTGVSLFGTTARYLDVGRVENSDVRRILEPFYAVSGQAVFLADANHVRYATDGPVAALRTHFLIPAVLDQVLTTLSLQAVCHHPFRFWADQTQAFLTFIWRRSAVPEIYQNRDFSFFVIRGLGLFEQHFSGWPTVGMLRHSTQNLRGYLEALSEVRNDSESHATSALERVHRQDPYHYAWVLSLMAPVSLLFPLLSWVPLAAFLSGLILLRDKENRTTAAVLLIYMVAHIVLTNLGGDADPRHTVPVEPIYWILLAGGVSFFVRRFKFFSA